MSLPDVPVPRLVPFRYSATPPVPEVRVKALCVPRLVSGSTPAQTEARAFWVLFVLKANTGLVFPEALFW